MIKRAIRSKTTIRKCETQVGETIEQKVERIIVNKEPIDDSAPIIYQPRQDGVKPEYDIRTDRFEVAIDAMDKVSKSRVAKRENYAQQKDNKKDDKSTGVEPIQATE